MTETGHRALLRFGLRVRALVEGGGFEPELWESGSGAVRRSILPRMWLNDSSTPGLTSVVAVQEFRLRHATVTGSLFQSLPDVLFVGSVPGGPGSS